MVPLPSRTAGEECSAAKHAQPFMRTHELLARRAGARVGDLGLLDLAPVVVIGGHDAAALEQALEARRALALAGASGGHRCGDLLGDFVAVRTVGADRPGWPAPRPADGVEPIGNAPALVDELAAFERHVRD